jgi:phosphoglycerate dehydrogenase-like enzyme
MNHAPRIVFYNSFASDDVYGLIRDALPTGCELVTLSADRDEERLQKIASANVVIVAATALTGQMIAAAGSLELVHHQGVGYHDSVDVDALTRRGIPIVLTPQGTTETVAEHTLMLMLAVLRRLPHLDRELRQGRWHINTYRATTRNLSSQVIGYLGMGRIGQAVAGRAQAFGARGLFYDPNETLDRGISDLDLQRCGFDEVLQGSDIITLHLPGTRDTRHLINAQAIEKMRPGAMLINTARGSLVDQAALCDALKSGRLSGAGLDCFSYEPPAPDEPLLSLPNVVLTPHSAGATRDALIQKMRAISHNIERFFANQPVENMLPPTVFGSA